MLSINTTKLKRLLSIQNQAKKKSYYFDSCHRLSYTAVVEKQMPVLQDYCLTGTILNKTLSPGWGGGGGGEGQGITPGPRSPRFYK